MARTYKERQKIFLSKLKEIHADYYDISKVEYINAKTNVILGCPKHGDFMISPTNIISLGRGCQKCSLEARTGRPKKIRDLPSFITVAREIHGNTYNYDKTIYVKALEKVIITCKEHGDFLQTPAAHYSGSGCPSCGDIQRFTKLTRTTQDYIKKAIEIHDDLYDYSKTNYINSQTPIIVTCKTHGDFYVKPTQHLIGSKCQVCSGSIAEKLIAKILTEREIEFHIEKTFPNLRGLSNGMLRFDFYLPAYNTVIEYQGHMHYWSVFDSDLDKQQYHDQLKRNYCATNDIILLEIPYWERNNIEALIVQRIGIK